MKARTLSLALLTLSLYAACAHASGTTGTVKFIGRIVEPASASALLNASTVHASIADKHEDLVSQEQGLLQSDVLDHFATYATKDAKLLTVSFQ